MLPVLVPLWHIPPSQIGAMISIGYLGQVVGGLTSGWLADKFGRVPVMVGNIILFSLMSFACVLAQDYWTLFAMRFVQGIGLGGEVPIANTYVSEFAPSKGRGRFVLIQQMHVPHRPDDRGPGRRLRHAELRLAVGVRARRAAGAAGVADDQALAGIAALARRPRPRRRRPTAC